MYSAIRLTAFSPRNSFSRTVFSLAPGCTLHGAHWKYHILNPIKGDGTHASSVFKARVIPDHSPGKALEAPKWALIKVASPDDPTASENLKRECNIYRLPGVASANCFRKLYDIIDKNTIALEWLDTTLAELEYRSDTRTYRLIGKVLREMLSSCVILEQYNCVNTDFKSANVLLSALCFSKDIPELQTNLPFEEEIWKVEIPQQLRDLLRSMLVINPSKGLLPWKETLIRSRLSDWIKYGERFHKLAEELGNPGILFLLPFDCGETFWKEKVPKRERDYGDYRHFATMASRVTKAQTNLMDPMTVPEQIDWTLEQAIIHSQPVYIELPGDMVDAAIIASRLNTPISVPECPPSPNEPLPEVLARIYNARQPLILVDGECRSLRILDEVDELVKITGWPTWTTVFGKGLVNEELPNVYGHYNGSWGSKEWQVYFESADLIIALGPHYTDTNSYHFTTIPREEVSVSLSKSMVQIGSKCYRDIPDGFLFRVLRSLDKDCVPQVEGPPRSTATNVRAAIDHDGALVQKTFYSFVNEIFRPNDLILTETGTAGHGGRQFQLPPHSRLFGPATWLSIGYMLLATLGAIVAKREISQNANARAILFIGDGSLQMSVQEIALAFFGGDDEQSANSFSARTYGELAGIVQDDRIQKGSGLKVVEVFMGQEDVQGALLNLMKTQIAGEQR
ncbi:hypothetical protein BO78DRAFT_420453 [Aspergillus sclerotiicarbonarius CBS 121057]|uniref:Thiamine pyrophosphate enzyme central domain-containing protein n=1 Tax=Aspergillus sclerotiicarbonarius (strain CBS 121057 / IBT 28362) TaxID=1448318 RepID=A0A319E3S1_ASPSB|nr:hypothetical protein BO78DRAFT_420453 [Aspergillus sclerotiicarbonarius CBS 121057]